MNNEEILREQCLMHYGIKGMRWGVRRRIVKVSKAKGRQVKQVRDGERRMSNKELKARINRMKLEQEYSRLVENTRPQTVSRVQKLVSAADTTAKLTSSGLTIYNNLNSIMKAMGKTP